MTPVQTAIAVMLCLPWGIALFVLAVLRDIEPPPKGKQ